MSPGRRKGYEELFGCLEQETAGTNWPRCLQSASPSLVPFSDWFPLATEQALPSRVTVLARTWVQVRL